MVFFLSQKIIPLSPYLCKFVLKISPANLIAATPDVGPEYRTCLTLIDAIDMFSEM